jgi:hypothetical protein
MRIRARLLLYEYWFGPIVGVTVKTRYGTFAVQVRIPEWLAAWWLRIRYHKVMP